MSLSFLVTVYLICLAAKFPLPGESDLHFLLLGPNCPVDAHQFFYGALLKLVGLYKLCTSSILSGRIFVQPSDHRTKEFSLV